MLRGPGSSRKRRPKKRLDKSRPSTREASYDGLFRPGGSAATPTPIGKRSACLLRNACDTIFAVYSFSAFLISSLLALIPSVTIDIGRACAANDARALASLFSPGAGLHVSLPDPVSFSDRLSHEQAYFLFERIFAVHRTYEFVPEPELVIVPKRPGFIFKARWSFRNVRNGNPYLFRIFFQVLPGPSAPETGLSSSPSGWEIVEIRAERL